MKLLNKLERKFGQHYIPNLTLYLVSGQAIAYIFSIVSPPYQNLLYLQGNLVLQGQFWRLLTFLFMPLTDNPFFILFALYLYYLYGSALENKWGPFYYQIYLLIAYLLTITVSFIFPQTVITNTYLYGSIFLAFAHLYPNFTIYLFFIIPVKIKWLAWLVWFGVINSLIFANLPSKIIAIVSVINYFLFFAKDLITSAKTKKGMISKKASQISLKDEKNIVCKICNKSEKDGKIFYVCDKCNSNLSYCEDHIEDHKHRQKVN